MLSKQEEEQERRATLENDCRVREQQQQQTGTFFSHGVSQALDTAGGRYGAAMGAPNVTGATPIPKYPAAGGHQHDPVGTEPPLGIDINAMPGLENPTGVSVSPPVATGAPAAESAPPSEFSPPTVDDVEPGAGAPPFSKDRPNE
jgi:hypothetical protein